MTDIFILAERTQQKIKRHNVYFSITAVHSAVKTAPKLKTQESTDSNNAKVLQPTIKNSQYSTEIKPLPLETKTITLYI